MQVFTEGYPVAFASRDMLRARSLLEACQIVCLDVDVASSMNIDHKVSVESSSSSKSSSSDVSGSGTGSGGGGSGDGGGDSKCQYLAYGQSINLVDIHSGAGWNVEAGPKGTLSVLVVAQGDSSVSTTEGNEENTNVPAASAAEEAEAEEEEPTDYEFYFHGNEYDRLGSVIVGAKDRSTKHRLQKFSEYKDHLANKITVGDAGPLGEGVLGHDIKKKVMNPTQVNGDDEDGTSSHLSSGVVSTTVEKGVDVQNQKQNRPIKKQHKRNKSIKLQKMEEAVQNSINSESSKSNSASGIGCFCPINSSPKDMVACFLGDTSNCRWPVFRNAKSPDSCVTVMSWVMDLESQKLNVWGGDNPSPSLGYKPLFTFDLLHPPSTSETTSTL